MLVGQGPGRSELRRSKAFAGQSGKTLNSWLESASGNKLDPRQGMYFTSVIKCCHSRQRDFAPMARKCAKFLERQIAALRPKMIITLGLQAYEQLRLSSLSYDDALCVAVHSSRYLLTSQFGFDFWLLPWPHPSGLNRWLNSDANRKRLKESFASVRKVLEASGE